MLIQNSTTIHPDKNDDWPAGSSPQSVRIAAFGDLHCPHIDPEFLQLILHEIETQVNVVILCGDLTHEGDPSEAALLAECLASLQCPVIGVLGNHDYEMGEANIVTDILRQSGMIVLDGDVHPAYGIDFVGAAKLEAAKLESSLKQSNKDPRIGILHYAPIRETVEGEPEEIIPFLGSSPLEDVLLRYPVDVVFHGHAHHGQVRGMTKNAIPVFNVAMPLLQRHNPSQLPVLINTLSVPKQDQA